MKTTFKLICLALVAMGIMGCAKSELNKVKSSETTTMDAESAKKEFAKILSKAVSNEPSLRSFIKVEALKQFDKDYDVFYPFVKDQVIDGQLTFREILVGYDEDGMLTSIEKSLPLLNILVPDWSWIDAFSVETWDTADSEISVAFPDNEKYSVYSNGVIDCCFGNGQIPGFPVLIIKNNERVRATLSTKAGGNGYEFVDSEFDGGSLPMTKKMDHSYYDRYFQTEDYSNFIPYSEIMPSCSLAANAFTMFKNNPYAVHRDHIYYGMTNDIKYGKLNVHITEYIAKFRFDKLDNDFLFDGDDFSGCPNDYTRYVEIDDDVLINKFCYGGNLELYFQIFVGNANGTTTEVQKFKSVTFREAFQLSKVHVDFKHKTWFTDRKWVFTVGKDCFVPKWIDLDVQLPKWDISNQSTVMNIRVTEYDVEAEEEKVVTIQNSFTKNFATEGELNLSGKIGNWEASGKVKVGYGKTSSEENSTKVTTTVKTGSDELGTALLYYTSPVILSEDTLNGVKGYRVKEIETGCIRMLILPRYE